MRRKVFLSAGAGARPIQQKAVGAKAESEAPCARAPILLWGSAPVLIPAWCRPAGHVILHASRFVTVHFVKLGRAAVLPIHFCACPAAAHSVSGGLRGARHALFPRCVPNDAQKKPRPGPNQGLRRWFKAPPKPPCSAPDTRIQTTKKLIEDYEVVKFQICMLQM